MSTERNEWDAPQVSEPAPEAPDDDQTDADAQATPSPASDSDHATLEVGVTDDGRDHHGRDDGRETLTVGESQRAANGAREQNLPAMSQNNASDGEKIAGIVAQTRVDVGDQDDARIADVLRQRFSDSGIAVADDAFADLVRRVRAGD